MDVFSAFIQKWNGSECRFSFSFSSRIFLADIFHNHMQPYWSGLLFGLLGNILVTSNRKLLCVWLNKTIILIPHAVFFFFFGLFLFLTLYCLFCLASRLLNHRRPWVYCARCKVYIDLLFHCGLSVVFYKLSGLLTTLLRDCLLRKKTRLASSSIQPAPPYFKPVSSDVPGHFVTFCL